MKNYTIVHANTKCHYCKKTPLICSTPSGADYTTCPLCDEMEFQTRMYGTNTKFHIEYYKDDDMKSLHYCDGCHILYEVGCTHAVLGCTDDLYNGHIICEWRDKKTDEIYKGMPYFDNADDWFDNVNDVEIIRWCCPNKNNICSYPFRYKTEPGCELCL